MIALADEDLGAARRFSAEAAEAAAGMAEPSLLANIASHRALAGLSAGDIPAAQRDADLAAEHIYREGPGVTAGTLDAMAVTACIALARGDAAGGATGAAKLAEQAATEPVDGGDRGGFQLPQVPAGGAASFAPDVSMSPCNSTTEPTSSPSCQRLNELPSVYNRLGRDCSFSHCSLSWPL